MNEPKTYRIERIVDLLQVPPEKRALCIAEVLRSLELAAQSANKINEADIWPQGVAWEVGYVEWIDDGKTDLQMGMRFEEGTAIIYDSTAPAPEREEAGL